MVSRWPLGRPYPRGIDDGNRWPLYRPSTALDRGSTAGVNSRAMFNRASAAGRIWGLPLIGAAVAETVDRGFDWGSAAAGAGVGAAASLLLVAFGAAMRGRRTGSHHRGGRSL
jgi:hypothetical protein